MKSPSKQNILTKRHSATKQFQMFKCGKRVLTGVTQIMSPYVSPVHSNQLNKKNFNIQLHLVSLTETSFFLLTFSLLHVMYVLVCLLTLCTREIHSNITPQVHTTSVCTFHISVLHTYKCLLRKKYFTFTISKTNSFMILKTE
jgi:hypothetical protein